MDIDNIKTVTVAIDDDGCEAIYIDDVFHSGYETIFAYDVWHVCKKLVVRIERLDVSARIEEWPNSLSLLKSEFKCA